MLRSTTRLVCAGKQAVRLATRTALVLRAKPLVRSLRTTAAVRSAPKQTTGIVGLPAIPNAREVLIDLYERTIDQAKHYTQQEPKSQSWNDYVIKICTHRMGVVQQNEDISKIEEEINSGQIEDLIQIAESELYLLKRINETHKPWIASPEQEAQFALHQPRFGAPADPADARYILQWPRRKPAPAAAAAPAAAKP